MLIGSLNWQSSGDQNQPLAPYAVNFGADHDWIFNLTGFFLQKPTIPQGIQVDLGNSNSTVTLTVGPLTVELSPFSRQNIAIPAGTSQLTLSCSDNVTVAVAFFLTAPTQPWQNQYGIFNALVSQIIIPGSIFGFIPTGIGGTNATAAMNIGKGVAIDSTAQTGISFTAVRAWSVANGNNPDGYQGGNTLPVSSTIHMFACQGSLGVCSFAANTLAPTLPAGFNASFRRVFSFLTDSTGAPLPINVTETEGGSFECIYAGGVRVDMSNATVPGGNRTLASVSTPIGLACRWFGRYGVNASGASITITSLEEKDQGNTGNNVTAPGNDGAFGAYFAASAPRAVTTDNQARIGVGSNGVGQGFYLWTRGYVDFRRV